MNLIATGNGDQSSKVGRTICYLGWPVLPAIWYLYRDGAE